MSGQLFCLIVSSSYVCSLYLIPASIRVLPRDNVVHVKYRLIASGVSTALSVWLTQALGYRIHGHSFLTSIGCRLDSLLHSIALTVFLMFIFYLGPLVVHTIDLLTSMNYEINWRGQIRARNRPESLFRVLKCQSESYLSSAPLTLHYRNLIHAPVTEEIVFRALMIVALASSSCSSENLFPCISQVALITPIWFAVAHVHHLLEKILVLKQSVSSAVISTLIQLTYTSIFGLIASYLFVKTGNLASPIVSHIMCNFFGLPDTGFLSDSSSKSPNRLSYLYGYRYPLLFLHALGLILFSFLILSPHTIGTIFDVHLRDNYLINT